MMNKAKYLYTDKVKNNTVHVCVCVCDKKLFLLDEEFYFLASKNDKTKAVLRCNSDCSNNAVTDVVWNIHLLSRKYNITLSCHNNSCAGKNEDTKLLKLENRFTMVNNRLEFQWNHIYQDVLVGCIVTTGNCTYNKYWVVRGGM